MKHYCLSFLLLIFTVPFSYGIKAVSLDSILGENNIILKTYKWVDQTFNSYDTAYVAGTGKYFNFKLKNDNWIDAQDFYIKDGAQIKMMDDIGCFIGASLGYRAVSVSYMMDVKNAFQTNSPSRKKVDFSFTCSRLSFNLFYAHSEGGTNIKSYGTKHNMTKVNHEFSGLKTESFGANVYYIFNSQKYSHAAAYSFSRIQKRSVGSFFLGASVSSHHTSLDFSSLPPLMQNIFEGEDLKYNFKYNDYTVMFGYGYNWVLGKKWLLGASLIPSMGLKHSFKDYTGGDKNLFSIDSSAKVSIVYNHSQYFAGLVGQYSAFLYMGDRYTLNNLIGSVNVSAGVRF